MNYTFNPDTPLHCCFNELYRHSQWQTRLLFTPTHSTISESARSQRACAALFVAGHVCVCGRSASTIKSMQQEFTTNQDYVKSTCCFELLYVKQSPTVPATRQNLLNLVHLIGISYPGGGREGGLYIHTPVMWLHCFDNRQPGGSRPAEVDEGEDAACVSQSLLVVWVFVWQRDQV